MPDLSLLFQPEKFSHRRSQTESLLQLEQECNELIPSWRIAIPNLEIPALPMVHQLKTVSPTPCTAQLLSVESITTNMRVRDNFVKGLFEDPVSADSVEQVRSVAASRALWEEAGPAPENLEEGFLSNPNYTDVQKQRWLEEHCLAIAVNRYRDLKKEVERLGRAANLKPAERLLLRWLDQLAELIQDKFTDKFYSLAGDASHNVYGPYLAKVTPEQIAVIVMHEVLSATLKAARNGIRFSTLCIQIADAVHAQLDYERIRSTSPHQIRYLGSQTSVRSIENATRYLGLETPEPAVKVKLGAWLLKMLLEVAMLPTSPEKNLAYGIQDGEARLTSETEIPDADSELTLFKETFGESENADACVESAFEYFLSSAGKSHRTSKPRLVGKIRCTLALLHEVEDQHANIESLGTRFQPMVIPPLSWAGNDNGAYLITSVYRNRIELMRSKSPIQQSPLQDGHHDLSLLCRALDILGRTPWRVNQFIYEVQKEAWEAGGGIGEIPSKKDIPFPPPLTVEEAQDPVRRRQHKKLMQKVQQLQYDAHGLRCCFRYQHKVAEDYKSLNAIYFPHNVDFRGRAYPLPPHLNHMGADLCRGLLTFSKSKPLGREGLSWLKIHLCNLFGNNKMSFKDRIRFTDDHMDQIRDSALKPLEGSRWWTTAEEPWQALAACKELTSAYDTCKYPEDYISSLPIHADGSCNGLQHYAALGGDIY